MKISLNKDKFSYSIPSEINLNFLFEIDYPLFGLLTYESGDNFDPSNFLEGLRYIDEIEASKDHIKEYRYEEIYDQLNDLILKYYYRTKYPIKNIEDTYNEVVDMINKADEFIYQTLCNYKNFLFHNKIPLETNEF